MQKIEDVILFQIDLTGKISKQFAQKDFDKSKMGITVDQWVLLKIVSESAPLTQRELAKKSYRDPASITRTLDLLENKKLLIRQEISNNRRTYNIQLTKEGKIFINKNMEIVNVQRAKSIEGLSNQELTQLSEILKKIRHNME